MTGPGGEDDGGGGGDPDSAFSDLMDSETRRLDPGPARIPETRGKRASVSRARGSKRSPFRWPDPADRHRAAAEGVSDSQLLALSRGDPEPTERIDLHGTRREEAERLLAKRIESAQAQGIRAVLVIHGRGARSATGEAILRDSLPDWLTRSPSATRVLAFAPAPERLGGIGATIVLLRRLR